MWINLKLSFYLLFLTFDTLIAGIIRFTSFIFVWMVLLLLLPFLDQTTVRKNLIESINNLDK